MSVILFDLFNTLIEKKHYDYEQALKWLSDTCFDHRYQELRELSAVFKEHYMEKRRISNEESSFREQLLFFEKALDLSIPLDYGSVEVSFIKIFRKEKLMDGAAGLLQYLHSNHDRIFILSNSLFSGAGLKAYLSSFNINQYVEEVYSSADIGYRKPSGRFFHAVMSSIGITEPNHVFYIGDSYEKDYIGALESGLVPVLISQTSLAADGLSFHNLHQLLDYLKCLA